MLPGGPELLVILFIVVLLFGANKVPKLARASGKAMGEFKRGRDEIERELREQTQTTDDVATTSESLEEVGSDEAAN
jgi:sec-independent protein translocase protein TatA